MCTFISLLFGNYLFLIYRIPDSRTKLMTALYFPFGVALVIIRLFITLHALLVTCILPKSAATRLVTAVGLSVTVYFI